jgi:hypothetical protein
MMASGTCKLTGDVGPLVKAHIFPKALTYPAEKGLPFAQAGRDSPPVKRWDSWYDPTIVTRVGEDILEEYDTFAIEELRRHQMIWSSWGSAETLPTSDFTPLPEPEGWGFRLIRGIDGARLRLFFLSLLWRTAVSEMEEFREVDVRASDIRRLRHMLLSRDPYPPHIFPMSLTQLSTKGAIHNHAPLAQRKPRDISKPNGPTVPIFRFYFDGLIAHIHRKSSPEEVAELGNMLVGAGGELAVSTVTFEISWQRENLAELLREAETRWPERLQRIPGFSPTGRKFDIAEQEPLLSNGCEV